MTPAEALEECTRIRKDLTNAQAKLTTVMEALAAMPDSKNEYRCPTCSVRLRGPLSLAEHIHLSHNGPVPDHYLAAEKAASLHE